jgi:hypothetical protein
MDSMTFGTTKKQPPAPSLFVSHPLPTGAPRLPPLDIPLRWLRLIVSLP